MLLRTRSIWVQASLLVLGTTLVRCQNYDSDYHGIEDEGEEHSSSYTSGGDSHSHPDYSKYYAVDTSAPQSAAQADGKSSGFVTPIEFSTFFGTPHFAFGASNNQEVLKPPILGAAETKNDATGFVNKEDFKAAFSEYDSDGFGVSNDFFEQAQKLKKAEDGQSEESAEPKPGPNYISHKVPAKKPKYQAEKKPPKKYEPVHPKSTENVEITDEVQAFIGEDKEDLGFKPSQPLDLAQFQPSNPTEIIEPTPGKLSYLPTSPEYYKKYAKPPLPAVVTPYQKYSFQPAASTFEIQEALQSTATAPFNPSYAKIASTAPTNYEFEPSETVSQNLKSKDCIRVNRDVKTDKGGKLTKQPMDCFVCKDPKSGAKFEQCSYSNEPTPKAYFQSTSETFRTPEAYRTAESYRTPQSYRAPESYRTPDSYRTPETYRNKRDESESYTDPYEEIKSKSHDYYSKPDEFEKEYYKSPDFSKLSEGYNYGEPKNLNDGEAEDKSYSEIQSESLVKKGGDNCQKSHKNGVTCTVCKDPKTGANYEQCSYESAPNEKKYAYVRESKYDGDGNPIEEKVEEGTEPKPAIAESRSDDSPSSSSPQSSEEAPKSNEDEVDAYKESKDYKEERDYKEEKEEEPEDSKRSSKLINEEPYEVPRHFAEATEQRRLAGVRGLDPELYGRPESEEDKEKGEQEDESKKLTSFDDYHSKIFPQFSNEESKPQESKTQPNNAYFEELSGKKDVEKVLEEFTKKDRSNCKQIKKKGMTCYLCTDKKGLQQEECMYVSESRPQSSHVAYHEVQHIKQPENVTAPSESPVETSASEIQKKQESLLKKVLPIDSEANASSNVETRVKFTPAAAESTKVYKKKPVKSKRNSKGTKKQKKDKDIDDDSKDPQPQFDVNDEDGLYSAETQPVYSKALGLSLPKYMLERSDFEKEFDRSVEQN